MKRVFTTAIAVAAALAPLSTAGTAGADPQSQAGQSQLIQRVIQRALSQRGVPYVYGGGDVSGPTNGARAAAARTAVGVTGGPAVTGVPGGSVVAGSATPGLP